MGIFSIRVMSSSGKPRKWVKVSVDFGFWEGQDKGYTDSDGWVSFDNLNGKLTYGKIWVDGENQGTHSTESGETWSFIVD